MIRFIGTILIVLLVLAFAGIFALEHAKQDVKDCVAKYGVGSGAVYNYRNNLDVLCIDPQNNVKPK